MLPANKNLKDTKTDTSISVTDISFSISYTKTHKLITALYMVTDIIDKEEPIRNKLRILGTEIISDMHLIQQNNAGHTSPADACNRIAETVSFLNIASAMNFISEMNCTILKKEFLELKGSIQEYIDMKPTWLAEFFDSDNVFPPPLSGEDLRRGFYSPHPNPLLTKERGNLNSKGHLSARAGTGLGVQKGSTLMKALSDRTNSMSDKKFNTTNGNDFDILKTQRRDNIISIIKNNGGNATIKDIRAKTNTGINGLPIYSEKTLQRELVSMIKDGVLNKTGEKRWSRYFIK